MNNWRVVPGYPAYEVGETGEVRRIAQYPAHLTGRVMSPFIDEDGYACLNLRKPEGGRKKFFIHQLVAIAFISGRPSADHEVAHGDGVKSNNHFSNLRWATRTENENDKFKHGTHNRGERHGRAKLTEAQAIEVINRVAKRDATYQAIADDIGVNRCMVSDIAIGRCWKHLPRAAS